MKAIILAAGRGSRMAELTDDQPKCLNKLLGKSLLDWQLESIRKSNIEDVTLVRGYKSHLLSGDYNTLENPEWQSTNMVSTLVCAQELLEQSECLVSYSDIVVRPSLIHKFISEPWCDGASIAISFDKNWLDLWSLRNENPLDDAESFEFEGEFLTSIGQKEVKVESIQGQYMGLLKFKPEGWRNFKTILDELDENKLNKLDMTSAIQLLLRKNVKIQVVGLKGGWIEADNKRDLDCFEEQIKHHENNNQKWLHDWRDQ